MASSVAVLATVRVVLSRRRRAGLLAPASTAREADSTGRARPRAWWKHCAVQWWGGTSTVLNEGGRRGLFSVSCCSHEGQRAGRSRQAAGGRVLTRLPKPPRGYSCAHCDARPARCAALMGDGRRPVDLQALREIQRNLPQRVHAPALHWACNGKLSRDSTQVVSIHSRS